MKSIKHLLPLLLTYLLAKTAATAHADLVPAMSGFGTVSSYLASGIQERDFSGAGNLTFPRQDQFHQVYGTAVVNADDDPYVYTGLTTTVLTPANDFVLGFAQTSLVYYFEISGPAPLVEIDVQSFAQATESPRPSSIVYDGAVAGLRVSATGTTAVGDNLNGLNKYVAVTESNTFTEQGQVSGTPETGVSQTFSLADTFQASTGVLYQVAIGTEVYVGEEYLQNPSAFFQEALVDPNFSISSTNIDASEYSIQFSSGFSGSPVPESSTYGIIGAAILCALAVRRKLGSAHSTIGCESNASTD